MNTTQPTPARVASDEPARCSQCGRLASVVPPDGICRRCADEVYTYRQDRQL